MKTFLWRVLVCVSVCVVVTTALAQTRTFTGQYSFGDSLSDSGNLFALSGRTVPPPPYFAGRFSNGPVFPELLGNPIFPGAAQPTTRGTYVNFAVGGASAVLSGGPPNFLQQIGIYRQQGFPARPTDLFTVLFGANDLLSVLSLPGAPANPTALDTIASLTAQGVGLNLRILTSLGAKNIVVGGMPNLGATPAALASGGPGGAGAALALRATNAFNNQLRTELQAISTASPDVNLIYVDLQGILDRIVTDAQALGFANATSFFLAPAARGGGVGDPNSYVFWDDIHPTARTHALVAAIIVEQLNPEPVLGFAATAGTAALTLQGLAASALDSRLSLLAATNRPAGRGDAYVMFNYGNGVRARDGWRPRFGYEAQVVTAGADWRRGDGWFGGAVNIGRLDASVRRGRGDFEIEDAGGRLYGVWHGGPVALTLEGNYGVLRVKRIRRTTAFGGLQTNARTSGTHWGVGGKASWSIERFGLAVRPWLGLRTDRVTLDAYSERDVPALALDFAEQEAKSTAGSIGVDAGMMRKLGARDLRFDVRVAWHDEIGNKTRSISGQPANNFTRPTMIAVEDGDGSGLEVGGAATLFFTGNWSASLGYTADIRSNEKVASRAMLSVQTGF